jgi:hypothetical protein
MSQRKKTAPEFPVRVRPKGRFYWQFTSKNYLRVSKNAFMHLSSGSGFFQLDDRANAGL